MQLRRAGTKFWAGEAVVVRQRVRQARLLPHGDHPCRVAGGRATSRGRGALPLQGGLPQLPDPQRQDQPDSHWLV